MAMNKKGFAIIISFMLGIVLFWLALVFAPAYKPVIVDAMSQANCSATDLTYQQQGFCTTLDAMLPFFIATIMGIAGIIIGGSL